MRDAPVAQRSDTELLMGDMNSINWPLSQSVAQLVEHRTGIAEATGSNPVEALIFSGFFFPIA